MRAEEIFKVTQGEACWEFELSAAVRLGGGMHED